ncbi:MAG: double-strand break repair protein AddB [Candidatus Pacebacteria bacterium]|nr:double-strand break repair protein AddB [Candidatus Paceibacterota bacterium]
MNQSLDKKLYSLPASAHFLESLAAGLLAETVKNPEQLRHYQIYLPNRRACRNLALAFFKAAQQPQALILPRMAVLVTAGAAEEGEDFAQDQSQDPELSKSIVSPLQRVMVFAELIHRATGSEQSFSHSLAQAIALSRLRDEMLAAAVEPTRLKDLVPSELAEHWQVSLDILYPVLQGWLAYLDKNDSLEAVTASQISLGKRIDEWLRAPPPHPIVLAGIIPPSGIMTELMAAVLQLPQGRVILPSVDCEVLAWNPESSLAATHPQAAAEALLKRLKLGVDAVTPWPADLLRGHSTAAESRVKGFARVLVDDRPVPAPVDLRVRRFDCPNLGGEAEMIALHLRETIESADHTTAALVTRDRTLARRVTVELQRLGLGVDDSGGTQLLRTPPGVFMMLVLRGAAPEVSPSELLALLKHPLARAGDPRILFLERVRRLEKYLLRGTRPGRGIQGMINGLTGQVKGLSDLQRLELKDWLQKIEAILSPLTRIMASSATSMTAAIAEWVRAGEALAADSTGRADDLWREEAGDSLARFCRDLAAASTEVSRFEGQSLPDSIAQLASGVSVYRLHPSHRRIFIFGPAEARLIHCDRMILGGLNEGSWPNALSADPWLSQPMRQKLGLETFDQRIGESAHDFLGCYGAPEVILTRSTAALREVHEPSRWLRLLDREFTEWPGQGRLGWIGQRDKSVETPEPSQFEPRPTPPLEARPKAVSPSGVRLWYNNPYGFYAKNILKLSPLDRLDAEPDQSDRGTLFHAILKQFVDRFPAQLPPDAASHLAAIGKAEFDAILMSHPEIAVFWQARFTNAAEFIMAAENQRREAIEKIFTEITGSVKLATNKGELTLTATADRIEVAKDGSVTIIDYKTGNAPSSHEVIKGFEPQLLLEAIIAKAPDGFAGLTAKGEIRLEYWQIKGGKDNNEIKSIPSDRDQKSISTSQAIAEIETGLVALFEKFMTPDFPYLVEPHGEAGRYDDYHHLARQGEWGVVE